MAIPLGRLDPGPDVVDGYLGFVAAPVDPHPHGAARMGLGVVEQVDQDPLQAPPVAEHPRPVGLTESR